jgi:hypothetical protein
MDHLHYSHIECERAARHSRLERRACVRNLMKRMHVDPMRDNAILGKGQTLAMRRSDGCSHTDMFMTFSPWMGAYPDVERSGLRVADAMLDKGAQEKSGA